MKKILLHTCVLTLSLMCALQANAQQSAHIADDVYVLTQGGPGSQFRFVGRVRSGEPVTILSRQNEYIQIRTEAGNVSWVPEDFVNQGQSKLSRLPQLERQLEELTRSNSENESDATSKSRVIEQQRDEIDTLNSQVQSLKQTISELENDIANMDQSNLIRWLTHGGMVAIAGMIMGLLVPYLPKRRKRRDDWV